MWVHKARTIRTEAWCVLIVCVMVIMVIEVKALSGPNVCTVKQKYNITKRVKYRAPMSVRTYEWCFSMPPRCSRWSTEMRDLTRLETEERIAEVAVCCPGYKMKDVSCVPICTNGKMGPGCTEDCPPNKWGPNCVNTCKKCKNGFCSRLTGECECVAGWQGESCDTNIPPMTSSTTLEELLTTLSTKTATTNITPKSTTTNAALTTPKAIITTQYVEIITSESITFPTVPATLAVETTPMITTTEPTPNVTTVIIPITSTTLATTTTTKSSQIITTTDNTFEEVSSFISTQTSPKLIQFDNNTTTNNVSTTNNILTTEEVTRGLNTPDNRKETNFEKTTDMIIPVKEIADLSEQKPPTEIITVPEVPSTGKISNVSRENFHNNILRIETTTVKLLPSTMKINPKEIWIRPAQKGEIPIADSKAKMVHEFPRHRIVNNKELITPITTPKTIIVSIIPTSMSYSTFKRIALTSSYLANKNSTNVPSYNITENITSTKAMLAVTEKPQMKLNTTNNKEAISIKPSVTNTTVSPSISRIPLSKTVTKSKDIITKLSEINKTNSMVNYNKFTSTVTEISSATLPARNDLYRNSITDNIKTKIQLSTERTRHFVELITTNNPTNVTLIKQHHRINNSKVIEKDINTANVTKNLTKFTTERTIDDEEFHILTEPEHITAVMGDKGTDRSSVDLISVIGIAGGVMMAVITVAVIIVMIERCKKPRYEDIRKINDIRMQVMIDNSEAPPPYVRSIFHTPLPEPPTSERCHYQPISTLDRNLKQFMRPVVVQTISPIMLENFREILECHYDHLPRRSLNFEAVQMRSSLAPSTKNHNELQQLRASVTESTIEALKCEAKLDVIDNTTSEPLYAEIPCWRPPSEHAVEIINLNGEAVTEL